MSAIEEIKARLDIVDIVSESVDLRRTGRSYSGLCPFHHNTRTPAFAVFPDTGTWRCFGECNEGGDIFSFVMKKEGWDFPTALRELAERAGVVLRPITPQEEEQAEEHDRLRELLENAVTFYRHQLLNTAAGKSALEYLRGRGLTDETIEAFGLGYAPDAWEAALNYFKGKGFSVDDMLAAGLVTEREGGGVYDRFRNRVMLPIRDERGRMAGFGARTLDPDGVPKYLNSPQTAIFDKGRILFGLDRARKAIRSADQAVIVEGYMGVLAPHQAGYANVVATMGTALTEDHLRLLKRFTRRIVLAMDSDAAGMKATLRGLEVARQTLDREDDVRFDARGLLRHEARLKADIRVSTLPPGMDPDDVINRDPAEWERLIAAARPVVVHVMETLATERDLEDPKVKSEVAAQVLPLIQDIPDAIERDTYRQRLARLLQVDERVLLDWRGVRASPRRRRTTPQGEVAPQEAVFNPLRALHAREAHILGLLIRQPDLIYHIDRRLQQDGLPRLQEDDFQHTDHQVVFQVIQGSLRQEETEPVQYVLNHLPDSMHPQVDAILKQTEALADETREKLLDDIMMALLFLRTRDVNQQLEHLRFLQEAAHEQGDSKAVEYNKVLTQYITLLARLHKAQSHLTASPAL